MKIDLRDVYEQLGNLFYSIAADQHIKPLEVAELKMLIHTHWPQNTDEHPEAVSEAGHYILVTMDGLQSSNVSAQEAYDTFAKFYALHADAFPKELKEKMVETASAITGIFQAKDQFGYDHLRALKFLLNSDTSREIFNQ